MAIPGAKNIVMTDDIKPQPVRWDLLISRQVLFWTPSQASEKMLFRIARFGFVFCAACIALMCIAEVVFLGSLLASCLH